MDILEEHKSITADWLQNPVLLRSHIMERLIKLWDAAAIFPTSAWDGMISSSVLLLIGEQVVLPGQPPEICIILNKRSRHVRQAGDLCCPGGTVEKQLDPHLARLTVIPGFSLTRWSYWSKLKRERPQEAKLLSLLFAAGLREGWEEMRLNPLRVQFLGPLPYQRLVLFKHVIHPMVGWVFRQKRFYPSWEVEKIVRIPLRSLLDSLGYARYRLYAPPHMQEKLKSGTKEYPCFLCRCENTVEVLWGATFKIVMSFLELVFGFRPPDFKTLPQVPGVLDEEYLYGRG